MSLLHATTILSLPIARLANHLSWTMTKHCLNCCPSVCQSYCRRLLGLAYFLAKGGRSIPLYVPCAKELAKVETWWTQLSRFLLPGRSNNSRHPQAGPAESLRSSLAAHRLTFCAIRRIRKRTTGCTILITVLLLRGRVLCVPRSSVPEES